MNDLPTKETNELIEKKIKKKNEPTSKTESTAIAKSFKSIISDFNVMPYLISFVIALSFNNLLEKLVHVFATKINLTNPLINAIIEFLLVLIIVYLFIYEIFYKYLHDETISNEKIVKTALTEAKIDEAKKNLEEDEETKEIIEKDTNIVHSTPSENFKPFFRVGTF